MKRMNAGETRRFWERANMEAHARELTPMEEEFIDASMHYGQTRWDGMCDVQRMTQLLEQEPTLLDTVGQAIVNITVAVRGCAPALELLLDRGLSFNAEQERRPDRGGESDPVHEAAWAGAKDNLRVLLERGMVDPNSTLNPHRGWPSDVSLLWWVANSGREDSFEFAQLLLDHGADPNGRSGKTPLHKAVTPGWNEQVTRSRRRTAATLIEHGAFYDEFSACALDDLDRLKALARADRDLVARGGGILHWAAEAGSIKCARWLLSHGADANAVDDGDSGWTPLHLAADGNHTEMIWLLAEKGADLNAADAKGRTPLHRATYGGKLEAAEVLIVLGASVLKQNKAGRTPLEVARKDCLFLRKK